MNRLQHHLMPSTPWVAEGIVNSNVVATVVTNTWYLLTRQVMKTVAHAVTIPNNNAKIGQMSGRLIGIAYLVVQYFE